MKYPLLLSILITIALISAGCITPDLPQNNSNPKPALPEPEEILEYSYNPETVEYLLPVGTEGKIVEFSFPFKNHIIKKEIAVSHEKYESLPDKNSEDRELYEGDSRKTREAYFNSFINDESGDELFEEILDFFDDYSQKYSLTSDEYVELAVSFVQNITYETEGYSSSKYPIETVYENKGDCDDKSILLAGLLSQKGYDVALLFFEENRHMTAAIKGGNKTEYPNSQGYSMIELTGRNYIGEIPKSIKALGGSVKLSENPEVFKIGNGYITYSSDETADILEMRDICIAGIDETQKQMDELMQKINLGEALAEQISDERVFNGLVNLHNEYVYLANLINLEPFNRAFVYEQVKAMKDKL